MNDDGDAGAGRPGWSSAGLLSLMLLILNAAILFGVIRAAGDGVDSGLGVVALVITFTLPMVIVTIVTGVIGVSRRRGRVPGVIALTISAGALLFGIWGFVSTQVF